MYDSKLQRWIEGIVPSVMIVVGIATLGIMLMYEMYH